MSAQGLSLADFGSRANFWPPCFYCFPTIPGAWKHNAHDQFSNTCHRFPSGTVLPQATMGVAWAYHSAILAPGEIFGPLVFIASPPSQGHGNRMPMSSFPTRTTVFPRAQFQPKPRYECPRLITCRFWLLIFVVFTLFAWTTSFMEINDGLEFILKPLKKINFPLD
ncbi:MAG: hypothetical protein Q8804_02510, partial [Pigeon pea little leaf phytoplasma]|nr:hypothetical protein [Pigeon pea little leaf phytoplasma]